MKTVPFYNGTHYNSKILDMHEIDTLLIKSIHYNSKFKVKMFGKKSVAVKRVHCT